MSTPLGELDERPNVSDGDLVQKILSEMNGGGNGGPAAGMIQPPPAIGMGGGSGGMMASDPGPNSMTPHTMDNGPATAHMIGNSHPSPADFAQAMYGRPSGQQPQQLPPTQPYGGSGGGAGYASYGGDQPPAQPRAIVAPAKKSWLTKALNEFRIPFFVTIIVFIFSLPVINFLFAHYLPSMVKPTGELKLFGMLLKSIAAGFAFWIIQRVIVPLLSI